MMNRRTVCILMTWAWLAASGTSAADARRLMEQGLSAYREARYGDALPLFEQAAEQAPAAELSPEIAHLNRGNTLYRDGQWEDAAAAYDLARLSPDLDLQAAAWFNLGNTAMQQADDALENKDGAASLAAIESALECYGRAMLLDPVGIDIKINRELAQLARTALLDGVQRVQEALSTALERVDERDYQGALDTLRGVLADIELAFSLDPDLEAPFVETLQRVEEVLDIQRLDEVPLSDPLQDKP